MKEHRIEPLDGYCNMWKKKGSFSNITYVGDIWQSLDKNS